MRKPRSTNITQERLKEVIHYSPTTGQMVWKRDGGGKIKAGISVGFVGAQGYVQVTIDRNIFHAHRLAWLYVYGEWPYEMITFANGDKTDIRISNLKLKKLVKDNSPVSRERLLDVLEYDSLTGIFLWRKSLSQRAPVGSVAGVILPSSGYRMISLDGKKYLAHRLAWLYVYGDWPEELIDHINRSRADNRIANLRKASVRENGLNTPLRSTNTSGFKGVSYAKRRKKWTARITSNYQVHILGYYRTKEEAYFAYCEAAKRLHGEFAAT